METINIIVAEKRATAMGAPVIVCGNSDYAVAFTFDGEWDGLATKTARFSFVKGGVAQFIDQDFAGNVAHVPVLSGVDFVEVGVYGGNLHTSTPARIPCARSILCAGQTEARPEEGAYFLPFTPVDELPEASEETKGVIYKHNGAYWVARGGGAAGLEVGQTYNATDKVTASIGQAEVESLLNGQQLGGDTSVDLFSVYNNMAGETWTLHWYQANDDPNSTSFCASIWNPAEYNSVGGVYDLINGGFTFDELNSAAGSGPVDGGFTITSITELGLQLFGAAGPKWHNLLTGEALK